MYRFHIKRPALWSSLLALLALFAFCAGAGAQQTGPKISDIVVKGNKTINREFIIATSGLKVGDPVTQGALDDAKRRLIQTGDFGSHHPDNPEQAVQVRSEATGDNAVVTIDVDENDVVQGINISGTGPVPAADVKALLKTKEGQVLNVNTLRQDVEAVGQYYDSKGYQAFVSEDLGMTNGILDIPIVVGKITAVKLHGLRRTKSFVVLREMNQKKGDYYNVFRLREDLTRLYNTDLFENVEPTFAYPTPGQVEVTLNIQEKSTGSAALGVGYSSRQSLVGFVELGESNFLGRGQQINLRAETGGIANRSSFELGFTEPWLDHRHTSLSVDLFDKAVYRFGTSINSVTGTTNGTNDYYETHTGGSITISRPFGETVRGYAGIRIDNVRVPSLNLNANDAAILQNGPTYVLDLRGTHNTRDYDINPAVGGYEILTLDIGQAHLKPVQLVSGETPNGVFGDMTFSKLALDVRRYFSPQGRRVKATDKRRVFALRLMAGTSAGRMPFSEQYFVGGAESLRGYAEDRFWGNNMFLGSFEFREPLANSLTGVLFMDAGDAWGGSYERVSFSGFNQHPGFSPSLGVGLGLRVVTPIGPIRIDEAVGREGWRTHFSIGHVF